jgi:hypothetical protein
MPELFGHTRLLLSPQHVLSSISSQRVVIGFNWGERHFCRLVGLECEMARVVGEKQSESERYSNTSTSILLLIRDSLRMLRIDKVLDKTYTVLRLSGRIREEYLSQLQTEIEHCTHAPKLDLKDVNLLDRPSVRFLMRCESQGILLVNCSLYIQEWISRERRRAVPQAGHE